MRARSLFAAFALFALGASSAAFADSSLTPTPVEQRVGQSLPAEHAQEMACRPSGAGCQVMNGKNPEPSNDLCCSQHCNWNNGSQAYLCD